MLATKTLNDLDKNLEQISMNKNLRNNEASFFEINKEKQRLAKVINLPPIERMKSVQKSLHSLSLSQLISGSKLVTPKTMGRESYGGELSALNMAQQIEMLEKKRMDLAHQRSIPKLGSKNSSAKKI